MILVVVLIPLSAFGQSVGFAGAWSGTWHSVYGDYGGLRLPLSQSGSSVSGTVTVRDSICGTVSIPISGTVSDNSVYVTGVAYCLGYQANYSMQTDPLDGDNLAGNYNISVVLAGYYDFGSFSLSRPATARTITATAGPGGAISPAGSVSVPYGQAQTFTITPNSGYVVDTLRIDGVSVAPATSYTFTNVTTAHAIAVTFRQVAYSITATAGAGGAISPAGTVFVAPGQSQTFTFSPNVGYVVDAVNVDGVNVGAASSYTFTNVNAPHSISVTFRQAVVITATAGAGGTIAPSGSVSVSSGQSRTFAITPRPGYVVDTLIVDGVRVSSAKSYTFRNVTAAHSIEAWFRPLPTSLQGIFGLLR